MHDPVRLGTSQAPNRLVFGPHETNLADGRAISDRHVAYYRRRAEGGAGLIVTEEASVHASDWPYERAPLATECAPGWRAVADAVHAAGTGTLVVAGLGHAGGQGSSAYSQQPLLAPSRVPEVNSREVPKWMEDDDITAVIDGFGAAARLASGSGLDGVEVNAGQFSLVRQFLSGLTNQRDDAWGTDRLAFARAVLQATRTGLAAPAPTAPAKVLGLRLSCDELAPWAGLTPESAAEVAVALAPLVDYLVVVRGSIFTASATRPDFHEPEAFNAELCRRIRGALREAGHAIPVVLQGSVVDPGVAQAALDDGTCDLVEMTRAQIADPALGRKVAAGRGDEVRRCTRCNQLCGVRDPRNPIVSCAVEPSSGHETDDPSPLPDGPVDALPFDARTGQPVLVVGGGPAGLEAARVLAALGHPVRLVDRGRPAEEDDTGDGPVTSSFGGRAAGGPPHTPFAGFVADLAADCARLTVSLETGTVTADDVRAARDRGEAVVFATGSRPGTAPYSLDDAAAGQVTTAAALAEGPAVWDAVRKGRADDADRPIVVVLDPIGGPIGVAAAEALAAEATVHLVTQDQLAGNELARTGDLAPANVRLQQVGVVIERRSIPRRIDAPDADGRVPVVIEDRFTGDQRTLAADFVIDAGFRLPDTDLFEASGGTGVRAGDCVAPRTVHEAVLEGRRAAVAVHEGRPA